MKNLLFVINPVAGDTDKSELERQLRDFCTVNQFGFAHYHTTGHDEPSLRHLLADTRPDAVVAVGGDGTVNLVGRLLIGTGVALGIVPLGSGNGLAKDLGIPGEPDEALDVIAGYHARAIDTLTLNDCPCLHLADLGFNALIVKRYSEDSSRGLTTYAYHLLREYPDYEAKEYAIETDGGNFTGKAFMVVVANANKFGSNAIINPTGAVDDGRFEIVVLTEFPKIEGLGILWDMFTAEIHRSARNHVLRCTRATVHNLNLELTQVDGEPLEAAATIEVRIRPSSLRVLLPRAAG